MHIFSKSQEKEKLMLVFNVGSAAVSGALFYVKASGIPRIVFSVRESIKVEARFNINRFLSSTINALDVVAKQVHDAHLGVPEKVFCTISSVLYMSQARTISVKKNTPFIFTEKLADELIRKEIKLLKDEHEKKYESVGHAIRPIELKNIKVLMNGYEVSEPLDQSTKDLEMTIFISMSGEEVLQKIESAIGKYFNRGEIKFSSFAMTYFTIARDMYIAQNSFLIVDIGGEVTDISVIRKNILDESISFPLGRNFLIRGIASALDINLDEASSLISLVKDGHATETTARKIYPILEKLAKEWLQKFQESLANISHDLSIPADIYLATERDLAEFFADTIKTEQFNQYTLTESKFTVTFLDNKILHGLATFEDGVVRDPALIIDTVYINRFLVKI